MRNPSEIVREAILGGSSPPENLAPVEVKPFKPMRETPHEYAPSPNPVHKDRCVKCDELEKAECHGHS